MCVYDSNAATYSSLKYLITNLSTPNNHQKQRERIVFLWGWFIRINDKINRMDFTQILAFSAVLWGDLEAFLKWEGDQSSLKKKKKKIPTYHTKESLWSSLHFHPKLFVLSLRFSRKILRNKFSLWFSHTAVLLVELYLLIIFELEVLSIRMMKYRGLLCDMNTVSVSSALFLILSSL